MAKRRALTTARNLSLAAVAQVGVLGGAVVSANHRLYSDKTVDDLLVLTLDFGEGARVVVRDGCSHIHFD